MHNFITKETLKFSDLILACLIVLAALAFPLAQRLAGPRTYGLSSVEHSVIVEVSGKKTHAIPFSGVSGSSIIRIPAGDGSEATIEVLETGKARVTDSPCPDKTCVRTGWISRPGQAIVCLPNRIVVRIEGSATGRNLESCFDAVTY